MIFHNMVNNTHTHTTTPSTYTYMYTNIHTYIHIYIDEELYKLTEIKHTDIQTYKQTDRPAEQYTQINR